ncbi:acyltransferase family protein [Thermodesulfobacteriota bacterium]
MKDSTIDTSPLSLFRFLAVVTVVFIHYGNKIENFYMFPNNITRGGSIITFFFILSGFGLFGGYQKQGGINLRQFFIKRTIRILPFYYLALLMMALILLISQRFYFTEFFLSLFCIQSWFPGYQHSINPPGWFVADLLFFYCLFPVIFFLIKKLAPSARKLLFSSILLWFFTLIIHNKQLAGYPATYYNYIDCFPISWFCSFFMGICGAYYVTNNETKSDLVNNNSILYTLLILILCSVIMLIHQGEVAELIETKLPFEANLYAPVFLILIINLSTARNSLTKLLSLRFFMLLGALSYPLYIFQTPIHTIYSHFISKPMKLHPEADFIFFLMIFMLFAWALTLFEKNIFKRIFYKDLTARPEAKKI